MKIKLTRNFQNFVFFYTKSGRRTKVRSPHLLTTHIFLFVLFRQVRQSHLSWPGAGTGSLYISGKGHDVRRNKTKLNTNNTTRKIRFVFLNYIYE